LILQRQPVNRRGRSECDLLLSAYRIDVKEDVLIGYQVVPVSTNNEIGGILKLSSGRNDRLLTGSRVETSNLASCVKDDVAPSGVNVYILNVVKP